MFARLSAWEKRGGDWDTLQNVVEDFDLEPKVQVGAVSVYQAYRLAVMHTKTLQPLPG